MLVSIRDTYVFLPSRISGQTLARQ